jgi:hypothetical protein
MARKPDEMISLKLRFPERLRKQIEKAAAKSERSMNSEIIYLLQQALQFGDLEAVTRSAVEAAAKLAVYNVLDHLERAEKLAGAPLSVGSPKFFESLNAKTKRG